MFQIIKNKRGTITLIELLVIISIIAIFVAISLKESKNAQDKAKKAQETSESKGQTITLEWKDGVRVTPETIEIVEGVSGITVNECNDIVLTLSDGSRRTIPKENLVEYRDK